MTPADYRVEKVEVPVTVTHIDGSVISGTLFASTLSPLHGGGQTIRELLEEPAAFLPLRNEAGEFVLVRKEGIVCVQTSTRPEDAVEFVKRVPIRLRLSGGIVLSGDLVVPQRDDSYRVSDFLNMGDEDWLRVEGDGTLWFAGRHAVLEAFVR